MLKRRYESKINASQLYERLAGLAGRVLLDDSSRPDSARLSILGCRPRTTLVWRRDSGVLCQREGLSAEVHDLCATLRLMLESLPPVDPGSSSVGPFQGGLMGFLGYDLKTQFEHLPDQNPPDSTLPDAWFGAYDLWLVLDEKADNLEIYSLEEGLAGEASLDLVASMLAIESSEPIYQAPPTPRPAVSNLSKESYLTAIARIKEYIAAGDVYQVNFTQRFIVATNATPITIFERIRSRHPAPYAALIQVGGAALSSHSPESFLRVEGRRVESRPIKGTRPRFSEASADAVAARALTSSEKDRAELAMIVDLIRNDLSRVAIPGSVKVSEHAHVESAPTVHHLVTVVNSELPEGKDVFDLLAATWPGGSITGAPKIRAMEIIDELESLRRGPYTGAVGYFSRCGRSELNIAIRSVVLEGGFARIYGGGGIVWDSDPESEWAESLVKIQGILDALDAKVE